MVDLIKIIVIILVVIGAGIFILVLNIREKEKEEERIKDALSKKIFEENRLEKSKAASRYSELKGIFFKEEDLEKKLNTIAEIANIEYNYQHQHYTEKMKYCGINEYNDIAALCEIVMRNCRPKYDDRIYAQARDLFNKAKYKVQLIKQIIMHDS